MFQTIVFKQRLSLIYSKTVKHISHSFASWPKFTQWAMNHISYMTKVIRRGLDIFLITWRKVTYSTNKIMMRADLIMDTYPIDYIRRTFRTCMPNVYKQLSLQLLLNTCWKTLEFEGQKIYTATIHVQFYLISVLVWLNMQWVVIRIGPVYMSIRPLWYKARYRWLSASLAVSQRYDLFTFTSTHSDAQCKVLCRCIESIRMNIHSPR